MFRLQKRIDQAQQRGNVQAVHSLQRLLMKSRAARMLAVRRVTQDNHGKKTAGVDGIKAVGPQIRLQFVTASVNRKPSALSRSGRCSSLNLAKRTNAAGYSRTARPGASSPGQSRTGTTVGSTL